MNKRHLGLAGALGALCVTVPAAAFYQIPAINGRPGTYLQVNLSPIAPYWTWDSTATSAGEAVIVRRKAIGTGIWVIPLVFAGEMGNHTWTVQVYASAGTRCSVQWRPEDSSGSMPVAGTAEVSDVIDNWLPLTSSTTCIGFSCTNPYRSAFVQCRVDQGGFVGAVQYSID